MLLLICVFVHANEVNQAPYNTNDALPMLYKKVGWIPVAWENEITEQVKEML